MKATSVNDCKLLDLPKIHNVAGNITSVNNSQEIPFAIRRVYYLYDVPGGEARGGHAHKQMQQVIVAASGSFDIIVDDGQVKKSFNLSRSYKCLYIPPGLWRELDNFSSGAICLALASTLYAETDYLRHYSEFLKYKSDRSRSAC